jgi:anti-anti-sigma regulatory factor
LTPTQKVSYRRQRANGTLTLTGIVDIFDAEALTEQARRALNDTKAVSVAVDLSRLERIDVTTLQVLLALQGDVLAAGRAFTVNDPPQALTRTLKELGLAARICGNGPGEFERLTGTPVGKIDRNVNDTEVLA